MYEACPFAMIEAMALSKPVVAFDRPFSRELFEGIPDAMMARSVQDYAVRLNSLCASENLRRDFGRRMRDQAVKRFDIETTAEKYVELYDHLLS
jgi:glycosyltransferase involved in cell wall biosynthesis